MDCTYCKVPLARGKSVSRDPAGVLEEAQELVRQGCPELVLTGINLGSYSWRGTGLRALIEMLLKALPASCGIRLSSLESGFFDEPLLHLIESTQRIAPHFHLPLQSGSDRILKLMRRPCTTSRIAEQVKRIRGARPESHIALDVIVGFPTETEEDFKQTMLTVKRIEAASLHVFRYSPREGTKAALMHNDVSHREKMRRSKELIELGSDLNHRFRKRFQGEILWGVVEVSGSGAKCVTANYIKVRLAGLGEAGEKKPGCAENPVSGTKAPVLIEKVSVDSTWGRVVGRRESGLGHISSRQL
jgi:threonylcarbamoyladenosine tRNA methylthiotransferase MtaB